MQIHQKEKEKKENQANAGHKFPEGKQGNWSNYLDN